MRITFIVPPFDLRGGQRVVATYAARLHRRGHKVTVVSPPHARDPFGNYLRACVGRRPWPRRRNRDLHFLGTDVPTRTLDRPRPVTADDLPDADVLVATWWETAEWVLAAPPRKGAKVYFIQHHEVFEYLPVDRVEATLRSPLQKVTISQWLVDLMRDRYGDPTAVLIHNSVDTDLFHGPPRGRQARPTVGFLYSTHSMKGCDLTLSALRRVAEAYPDLQVVAFGNEPIDRRLPLPPGGRYWCAPPQESIRDLYSLCDVWVCGSRTEGFHLPPLEAMACRCPVVSTRVGGPVDIVRDRANGFLVDVGDVDALADRVKAVLARSPEDWRAMSDAALATATQYTWDDATDLFERALREFAGN